MSLVIEKEQESKEKGWICPKCERVHGPQVDECRECNSPIKYVPIPVITPYWIPQYPWSPTSDPWGLFHRVTTSDNTLGCKIGGKEE